jgi:hypothetical protein
MTSGLGVLAIGAIMAIAAIVQTLVTGWQAAKRQSSDWARADVIDKRKEKAAEEVAKRADERAAVATDAAKNAADTAQKTLEIATTTHALVNSDFTKVKMALLTALEMAADLMRGGTPNAHKLADTLRQIDDLRSELNKRALIQDDINKGI